MGEIIVTKRFNAPRDRCWTVVSDLHNAAQRVDGITNLEVLGDGPIGVGTRFKETRIMMKKSTTEEMEITGWNPPESYTVESNSCGAHFKSVVSCKAAPDDPNATDVTMHMEYHGVTTAAKVMGALLGWMTKGVCRKAFDADLEDLKRAAENGADPAFADAAPA